MQIDDPEYTGRVQCPDGSNNLVDGASPVLDRAVDKGQRVYDEANQLNPRLPELADEPCVREMVLFAVSESCVDTLRAIVFVDINECRNVDSPAGELKNALR